MPLDVVEIAPYQTLRRRGQSLCEDGRHLRTDSTQPCSVTSQRFSFFGCINRKPVSHSKPVVKWRSRIFLSSCFHRRLMTQERKPSCVSSTATTRERMLNRSNLPKKKFDSVAEAVGVGGQKKPPIL